MKLAFTILAILAFTSFGCKNNQETGQTEEPKEQTEINKQEENNVTNEENSFLGNYVDDGYSQREEGYDWVSVAVTNAGEDEIYIKVRSRADQKKPTCTFDARAQKVDDNTYSSIIDGKTILYTFEDDVLKIVPENPEFKDVLAFYCSGGGNVAGSYSKIEGKLDTNQIDKTLYSKVLMLQNIGFNIRSIEKDGNNTLTVNAFGLEQPNQIFTIDIKGTVENAEVEDLNSDGSPELVVYTQTQNEEEYGHVYGFTTNNKKSMSLISFPSIKDNPELTKGYQGHDEFALVETYLAQRFPIYENDKPTGKMRQITYKLKEGEAMRSFEVDRITEF